MTVPKTLNETLQETQIWLKELAGKANLPDEHHAYAALRATLQQLRDRLTVDEAVDLGAQLPLLIRGVYYDAWRPRKTPEKLSKEGFMSGVRDKLWDHPEIDVDDVVPAVFAVLSGHVSEGEITDVKGMLPKELQQMWPH